MKPVLYIIIAITLAGNHQLLSQNSAQPPSSACSPPLVVTGLFNPDAPNPPNPPIFLDLLVKAEIMQDGFQGTDKEYGDIDNDGDIDILYTKNNNELWFIPIQETQQTLIIRPPMPLTPD
jgi:hypothetical protein